MCPHVCWVSHCALFAIIVFGHLLSVLLCQCPCLMHPLPARPIMPSARHAVTPVMQDINNSNTVTVYEYQCHVIHTLNCHRFDSLKLHFVLHREVFDTV